MSQKRITKQRKSYKRRLILRNHQSVGDIVMLAYAVKALHEQYPGKYLTGVDTSCNAIFEGNPYVTDVGPDAEVLQMDYPSVHESNQKPYHFVNAFGQDLAHKLNIHLEPTEWNEAIYITEIEKSWISGVHEILGSDPPFWIIAAGYKTDFTAKQWDMTRYQQIIDRFPEITFVQIGAKEHTHPTLTGPNLLNFVGKTDLRQLIRLVWHSFGTISPVTALMHLSYAIPPHPRYKRKSRASIIIAGGREPNHWQQPPNQQFLHTCGMLDCCDMGGSWASRVIPIGDGDEKDTKSLCHYPVKLPSGQTIAKCMDMISADEVCLLIKKYHENRHIL